jgi:hypothetical protein
VRTETIVRDAHVFAPSATELGIYGTYAHDLGELEVVLTTSLACAAHVIFTTAGGKDICIVHASDSVSMPSSLLQT